MDSMESAEKSYSDMFRERDNYGEDFNSANIDLVGKLRRQSNVEGGLADLKLQTFFTPQQITRASSIMTRRSSSVMTRRSSFDRAMTQLSSLKKKMRDSMGSSTKYGYGINTDSVLKAVQELCHVRTSDRLEIHTMLQASASHFRMINRPTKDKESVKEPEECEDEKQQKQNILGVLSARMEPPALRCCWIFSNLAFWANRFSIWYWLHHTDESSVSSLSLNQDIDSLNVDVANVDASLDNVADSEAFQEAALKAAAQAAFRWWDWEAVGRVVWAILGLALYLKHMYFASSKHKRWWRVLVQRFMLSSVYVWTFLSNIDEVIEPEGKPQITHYQFWEILFWMFCMNLGISIYPHQAAQWLAALFMGLVLFMWFTVDDTSLDRYCRYSFTGVCAALLNLAGMAHSTSGSDYRNKRIEVLRKRFYFVSRKLMILCPQNIQTDIILGACKGSYFYNNCGILYADIKGFTAMSSNKTAEDMVKIYAHTHTHQIIKIRFDLYRNLVDT